MSENTNTNDEFFHSRNPQATYDPNEVELADKVKKFTLGYLVSYLERSQAVVVNKEVIDRISEMDMLDKVGWAMYRNAPVSAYRLRTIPSTSGEEHGNQQRDSASAAIEFALEADEGLIFLNYWNEGNFEACRRGWPDAPSDCYRGADQFFEADASQDNTGPLSIVVPGHINDEIASAIINEQVTLAKSNAAKWGVDDTEYVAILAKGLSKYGIFMHDGQEQELSTEPWDGRDESQEPARNRERQ